MFFSHQILSRGSYLWSVSSVEMFQGSESVLRGNADPKWLSSIEEQCFTAVQCNAVYESVYLLGTSLARP